jgi:hypothetical protein
MNDNSQTCGQEQWTPRTWVDFWSLPARLVKKTDITPAQKLDADTATETQIVSAIQLDVLGKVGYGKVKIFSRYHRQVEIIAGVSKMKLEELLEIAGPPAKACVVESSGGDSLPAGTYTIRDVRKAISILAGFHKITDEIELGPGCWAGKADDGKGEDSAEHESVVLVGNREAADWNGSRNLVRVEHPRCRGHLLDFDSASKSWFCLDRLAQHMRDAQRLAWREEVLGQCIELFGRWRWRDPGSTVVLAGLAFATWVQTLWEWRPQVTVIGKTKSGKSMLFKALAGLYGNLCKTCSDSTEAGIRQAIENSARVILFDEFDAEDKKQSEEQQKILKMLRSSGRGDSIFRGTSNQKGREFSLRHIVWLAGIQISSSREADRNRHITVEPLQPLEEMRNKLTLPSASELADLGQRMLAAAVYCVHEARRAAVRLKDTRIEGVDDRVVESYAVPAAMLAAIKGDNEAEARGLLEEMLKNISKEDHGGQSDEQRLMADILGAKGIPNRVDDWGKDWPHDWQTWRAMLPKYLDELVAR